MYPVMYEYVTKISTDLSHFDVRFNQNVYKSTHNKNRTNGVSYRRSRQFQQIVVLESNIHLNSGTLVKTE